MRDKPTGTIPAALIVVFSETAALFHRLRYAHEQIHHQGELSAGRRSVLQELDRLGPRTVAQMARARPISRQYIQVLVDELKAEGCVELLPNPIHKRSHLVHLMPKGKTLIDAMKRREMKILAQLRIQTSERNLQTAITVLRDLRQVLQSTDWHRLLTRAGRKTG